MAQKYPEIDLRSDTVTRPSEAMRRAIATAEVGDMVFGDDPTVLKLEAMAAELLGKEAGLFVSSGTMSNLIAVLCHCWGRGLQVVMGDVSHMFIYEQGNIAQFAGTQTLALPNLQDGTFDLETLKDSIGIDDPHFAEQERRCAGAVGMDPPIGRDLQGKRNKASLRRSENLQRGHREQQDGQRTRRRLRLGVDLPE